MRTTALDDCLGTISVEIISAYFLSTLSNPLLSVVNRRLLRELLLLVSGVTCDTESILSTTADRSSDDTSLLLCDSSTIEFIMLSMVSTALPGISSTFCEIAPKLLAQEIILSEEGFSTFTIPSSRDINSLRSSCLASSSEGAVEQSIPV